MKTVLYKILITIAFLGVTYSVIYQILLAEYHIKKWWERKKQTDKYPTDKYPQPPQAETKE
jgi:hypothetical protein